MRTEARARAGASKGTFSDVQYIMFVDSCCNVCQTAHAQDGARAGAGKP